MKTVNFNTLFNKVLDKIHGDAGADQPKADPRERILVTTMGVAEIESQAQQLLEIKYSPAAVIRSLNDAEEHHNVDLNADEIADNLQTGITFCQEELIQADMNGEKYINLDLDFLKTNEEKADYLIRIIEQTHQADSSLLSEEDLDTIRQVREYPTDEIIDDLRRIVETFINTTAVDMIDITVDVFDEMKEKTADAELPYDSVRVDPMARAIAIYLAQERGLYKGTELDSVHFEPVAIGEIAAISAQYSQNMADYGGGKITVEELKRKNKGLIRTLVEFLISGWLTVSTAFSFWIIFQIVLQFNVLLGLVALVVLITALLYIVNHDVYEKVADAIVGTVVRVFQFISKLTKRVFSNSNSEKASEIAASETASERTDQSVQAPVASGDEAEEESEDEFQGNNAFA